MPLAASSPLMPDVRRVLNVHRETSDTVTLTLEPPDHGFAFAPGQFNMLYAFAAGESAISMSGDAEHDAGIVHTIRAVGPVTRALCALGAGDAVGVRGPFGQPWPMAGARGRDLLILAGGLGLAPLRPAIYHALHHRADYGDITVLVGTRTPDDLLFAEEVARWGARADVQVLTTVDRAPSGWPGHVGVVPALLDHVPIHPDRLAALVCGPEVMMRVAARELLDRGVPAGRVFLSMERSMKCGIGLCGHCQYGPHFVCTDGPVFSYDRLRDWLHVREV